MIGLAFNNVREELEPESNSNRGVLDQLVQL